MNENIIAERVSEIAAKKNISFYRMSYDLGQCRSYMGKIASGEIKPSMNNFFAICDYFEITPVEFFDSNINKETQSIVDLIMQLSESDKNTIFKVVNALLKDKISAIPKELRLK